MAEYRILFRAEAEAQIQNSYEWGLQYWGEDEARLWLREVYIAVFRRLTTFPLSCPVAPESAELDTVVRQYLFRRYRILFKVIDDTVIVLQFVGAFKDSKE